LKKLWIPVQRFPREALNKFSLSALLVKSGWS